MLPDSVEAMEGRTRLLLPKVHSEKGPGKRMGHVFFNSQMAFNRDVSVMFARAVGLRGKKLLDAMAGTGARGLRIANEAGPGFETVLNDKDQRTTPYIEANIELNSLANCRAENRDLRCLLASEVFDYVDLDPFGSPVPFVQASLQGLKRRGILAITATDTAPLAGTHAKKCVRRYMARPSRGPIGHEVGLRILIGYLVREAAQLDRGLNPILCFYADHYFRCYLLAKEGAAEADESLAHLGRLTLDEETRGRAFSLDAKEGAGPLWGGDLYDRELLDRMEVTEGLQHVDRCAKYLKTWREELEIPYFYENNELASLLKQSPPILEGVISKLRESGRASRTHFSPTGFKTDVAFEDVLRIYRDMA
ncbi:MAG: tRNA (guanine(26)-N(2))-dimethyltransferase [Methanomassiliicoccales archaeon]|nr:tRNA (guanine(26)-N(2))-dimethyltransferase [Methanomassiliicoccales archaeon]